jgi:hypothetical protein
MKTVMPTMTMNQEKSFLAAGLSKGRLSKEVNRLLSRLHTSSRSVVKSTLNELRDLKNSLKTDLARSYEVEQQIRERRDELLCRRLMSGGRML